MKKYTQSIDLATLKAECNRRGATIAELTRRAHASLRWEIRESLGWTVHRMSRVMGVNIDYGKPTIPIRPTDSKCAAIRDGVFDRHGIPPGTPTKRKPHYAKASREAQTLMFEAGASMPQIARIMGFSSHGSLAVPGSGWKNKQLKKVAR